VKYWLIMARIEVMAIRYEPADSVRSCRTCVYRESGPVCGLNDLPTRDDMKCGMWNPADRKSSFLKKINNNA
jgi:hypothetical protein